MIDDNLTHLRIPHRRYQKIEEAVTCLYKELKIKKTPIKVSTIIKKKGYVLVPYSQLNRKKVSALLEENINGTSFFDLRLNNYVIYYNDNRVIEYQRFTIMHEIGHILLGHKEESELARMEANYFAAYALAPSPLIHLFSCEDFIDLISIFKISRQCAEICFGRYLNWQEYSGNLKKHELDLLNLFDRK